PVADLEPRRFTRVFFILRYAAYGAKAVKIIIGAHRRVAVDNAMRTHHSARTNDNMLSDDAVWADLHIVCNAGAGRDNGSGVYQARHDYSSSTRMAHMILASATTCPSTVARAEYLQMERLMRSAVTSSRNWSPGTTGLRKRAPSTPTR